MHTALQFVTHNLRSVVSACVDASVAIRADRDHLPLPGAHDLLPPFLRSPPRPIDVCQLADVVHLDRTLASAQRASTEKHVHDGLRPPARGFVPCHVVAEAVLSHPVWLLPEGHTAEGRD